MPAEPGTVTLPLLTLGLPARVAGWLSDAGLPSAPVDTAAVRRGIGPTGTDRPVVLYDSRNASARADGEAAAEAGYETVDAGLLLSTRATDADSASLLAADPRKRFFDLLRQATEGVGGVWVRIADLPAPFRWAVCTSSSTLNPVHDAEVAAAFSAFGDLSAGSGRPGRLPASDWLKTCAASGRPVLVPADAADAIRRTASGPGRQSLVWATTDAEFADWWRYRRGLDLRVCRRGRTLEITMTTSDPSEAVRFPAALEIWRGRHTAVVPVRPGTAVLRDDALPFQINSARHHAGFTTDAAEPIPAPAVSVHATPFA